MGCYCTAQVDPDSLLMGVCKGSDNLPELRQFANYRGSVKVSGGRASIQKQLLQVGSTTRQPPAKKPSPVKFWKVRACGAVELTLNKNWTHPQHGKCAGFFELQIVIGLGSLGTPTQGPDVVATVGLRGSGNHKLDSEVATGGWCLPERKLMHVGHFIMQFYRGGRASFGSLNRKKIQAARKRGMSTCRLTMPLPDKRTAWVNEQFASPRGPATSVTISGQPFKLSLPEHTLPDSENAPTPSLTTSDLAVAHARTSCKRPQALHDGINTPPSTQTLINGHNNVLASKKQRRTSHPLT
ncbi:hypothetical protein EDB87DRAFT_1824985 [Lactarius vividus]|nr:hypothetical protein EDB87DRAFT_1824985 [Lactarius vividus]